MMRTSAPPLSSFIPCILMTVLTSNNNKNKNIDNNIRGSQYSHPNSTIPPTEQVASTLSVQPPTSHTTKKLWKFAFNTHKRLLPLLHFSDPIFDTISADSHLSLMCLWWKVASANDHGSRVHDNGLLYDTLPSYSRWLVSPWMVDLIWAKRMRLHHANMETRTVYLDDVIRRCLKRVKELDEKMKVRLISMGSGYDLRSVRFLSEEGGGVDEAYELDLKNVIDVKTKLFCSTTKNASRLRNRRPELRDSSFPQLIPVDLNHVDEVHQILNDIMTDTKEEEWYTIFVFEGVMIYLDNTIPSQLLRECSNAVKNTITSTTRRSGETASLCFADRLEHVPGGNRTCGETVLERYGGWELVDWLPKPGLARHMGLAHLS